MVLNSRFWFFIVLVFLVLPVPLGRAAEIININYKYKVAFTDMTENEVKAGGLVIVTLPDGKKAKLKVLETFPVMAKLTVVDEADVAAQQLFAAITVGNFVEASDNGESSHKARISGKDARLDAESAKKAEAPAHIESYTPGAPTGTPVKEQDAGALPQERAPQAATPAVRAQALEQRLDEMMANNVKLVESITQLLTQKNAAEALVRSKEADAFVARKKANELADDNVRLNEKINGLTVSVEALGQEKTACQKEIDNLNLKLGELKKKLAKMVEIVNSNMKAYEKQ